MKQIIMLSLVFFFTPRAPAFAADSTDEPRFSLATGATYGFLVNGSRLRTSRSTGIFLSFDYALDTHSSLFASYNALASESDSLGSFGYKYWLTEASKLRPWIQVAAGTLWNKSTAIFPEPDHAGREHINDIQFSFGGGVRYALAKNLGLDASAVLFKAGAPWRWTNSSKLLNTSLGADLTF